MPIKWMQLNPRPINATRCHQLLTTRMLPYIIEWCITNPKMKLHKHKNSGKQIYIYTYIKSRTCYFHNIIYITVYYVQVKQRHVDIHTLLPCHVVIIITVTILNHFLLWLIYNEVHSKDPFKLRCFT